MKKTAWVLMLFLIILLSILIAVEVVDVAEANPFFMFDYIEPIAGAVPPTIAIYGPMNSTISSSDIVNVSLNITKPEQPGWTSSIIRVEYCLDNGVPIQLYSIYWSGEGSGIPEFNTDFSLYLLSAGQHSLKVEAVAAVRSWNTRQIFWIRNASTVFFTVGTEAFRPAIASMTLVAAIAVGLVFQVRKHKH